MKYLLLILFVLGFVSCAKYEQSQPYKIKGKILSKSFKARECRREYTYGVKWNGKMGMRWTTNCYGPYYDTNVQSEKGLQTFNTKAIYNSYNQDQEVTLTCVDRIKVEEKEIQGSNRKREIRTIVSTRCKL